MKFIKKIVRNISYLLAKRSNKAMREYYRARGCKIGNDTRFTGRLFLGSEPYLIEIGEDCLIAGCTFHTHDGGVKVLNTLGYFGGKRMDKMGRISRQIAESLFEKDIFINSYIKLIES